MDARKELWIVVTQALVPTYRIALLKNKGMNSPLIIWSNPGGHYQFVVVDLDDAAAAEARGGSITIFLVDSLGFSLNEKGSVTLYILAAIRFMKMGLPWMTEVVQKKKTYMDMGDGITNTFLDDLKKLKVSVKKVSMQQKNFFDCGIFVVLQMLRVSKFLYGTTDPACPTESFKKGDELLVSHLTNCLNQRIGRSLPPTQNLVDHYRTSEFLYLLSLWIYKLKIMLTGGGLSGLNKTFNTTYTNIYQFPYTGVIFEGNIHNIKSVYHKTWQITTSWGSEEVTIKWLDVKFYSSPSAKELTLDYPIHLRDETDKNPYGPSILDLCKFFPGHKEDKDKYLGSDYLFWKLRCFDEKMTCSNDAIVGLGINTFSVKKAAIFMEKLVDKSGVLGKRERGGTSLQDVVDLVSEDED